MTRQHTLPSRRYRPTLRGIALIEALVGIMIFAFGVLGVIGLQATMTKAQTASKFRADASNLGNELVGLMWSDTSANLSKYGSASCSAYARCREWSNKVQTALPQGTSTVVVTQVSGAGATTPIYEAQITVGWTQPGEQGSNLFSLVARIEL